MTDESTPLNCTVVVVPHGTGPATDITEAVRALYDMVRSSLNWGSGFYTVEDVVPVLLLARLMGLPDLPDIEAYILEAAREEVAEDADRTVRLWRAEHGDDEPMPADVLVAMRVAGRTSAPGGPQQHVVDVAAGIAKVMGERTAALVAADMPEHAHPTPTPPGLVPSEALAVLDPDEERVVQEHFDSPPVKAQVRTGPPLPPSSSAYLQP